MIEPRLPGEIPGGDEPPESSGLITVEKVYPAMERAFLNASTEISVGYSLFDLATKLRSDPGCAILSSANLNGRLMNSDTEAGVIVNDSLHVQDLTTRIFHHRLGTNADPSFSPPEAPPRWVPQGCGKAGGA